MTETHPPSKTLLIALIEKGDSVLMRKKPAGSLPYKETWYLFGCEREKDLDDKVTLTRYIKEFLGIEITVKEQIYHDDEVKQDHDGIVKHFYYTDFLCTHANGEPVLPPGTEKIAWIPRNELSTYDIVPPSVKLFKESGYL